MLEKKGPKSAKAQLGTANVVRVTHSQLIKNKSLDTPATWLADEDADLRLRDLARRRASYTLHPFLSRLSGCQNHSWHYRGSAALGRTGQVGTVGTASPPMAKPKMMGAMKRMLKVGKMGRW